MRLAHVLAVIGLLFFAGRTAANTVSLAIAGADQSAKLQAIDHMPSGARVVAAFFALPCKEWWPLPRNSHLGAMVDQSPRRLLQRPVADGGREPDGAKIHARLAISRPTLRRSCVRTSAATACTARSTRRFARCPSDEFDYIWLIDVREYDPALVADMREVWRGPGSVLYRDETMIQRCRSSFPASMRKAASGRSTSG